ncbi:hypothetical protein M9H77_06512 [Catharanthus roseus]|uniref:Uncharacterized protein n=1 Tax=Catharanthus roseus TaxID=4058 RepID=A0ACC0BSB1_CATRO|nr:hypothetical protein M9H77_06512 [Catharanthus roseus]
MTNKMFSADSMYNFPSRSTSSFPLVLRLMTNGRSLFIPNSRTQFYKPVRCIHESEFNFNTYRLEKLKSINKVLEATIPLKEPSKLYEAIRYSVLSDGKRTSPLLCIACCELVGGCESTVMPVACAIEMLRTVWTIADDLPCMDNDDFRRGKPSTHKIFGEAMTILVSYSVVGLAFEHIAKVTNVSSANIVRLLSESARLIIGAEGVSGGQAADLDAQGKSEIGIEHVEYIHLHKACPTFEAAAVAGAIVGGASEDEINKLRNYAKYMGLLYQIRDDILDEEKDQIFDKATYPKLIGKEKSMELVEKLLKKAENELVGFDPEKAAPLKGIANFAAHMKS